MYNSALRNSPIWSRMIPSLASPTALNLRSTHLPTHDLSIPIALPLPPNQPHPQQQPQRTLHILLLTATTLSTSSPTAEPTFLARLERLVDVTGGVDITLIFLLDSVTDSTSGPATATVTAMTTECPIHAYARLQVLLYTTPSLLSLHSHIHILPLSSTSALVSTLQAHVSALSASPTPSAPSSFHQPVGQNQAMQLLRYCTSTAPERLLSEHAVLVVMGVVGSFGEAVGGGGGGGHGVGGGRRGAVGERLRGLVEGLVEEGEVRGWEEFWKEEWVVE